eukprot:CAMPEP_0168425068 /NCGR_PEP_ID=MMETSP0228-20121227/35139_1 /TAXON_ID=133427 /ORGANISM="Protoceratium reticulatum, Strain CCCM 535 (=CCMP 1889)" /LENGTH=161 /DNA_ID=CAMNT_0008439061 /DNA_START=650 /DNA_END=1135 /DNA_ORIENTATION=+
MVLAASQRLDLRVTLHSQWTIFVPPGTLELISGTSTAVFRGHSSNCSRRDGYPDVVNAMPVSGQRYPSELTSMNLFPVVVAIQSPPSLVGFCHVKASARRFSALHKPGSCTSPAWRVLLGGCSCPGLTCSDLKTNAGAQKPGLRRATRSVNASHSPLAEAE